MTVYFRLYYKTNLGLEFGYPLDPYLVEHYYPNRSSFYHSVSPTVHSNLSDNMPDSCSSPDSHYSQSHSPNSNCTSLVLTQSSRTRQSRRPSADLDKKRIHKCSYEGTSNIRNIFRKLLWFFGNICFRVYKGVYKIVSFEGPSAYSYRGEAVQM